MGGKRIEPTGHYEVRDHIPAIGGLVDIMWRGDNGETGVVMTLSEERIPMLAEALADWELRNTEPPVRRAAGLRVVNDDGTV